MRANAATDDSTTTAELVSDTLLVQERDTGQGGSGCYARARCGGCCSRAIHHHGRAGDRGSGGMGVEPVCEGKRPRFRYQFQSQ